MNYLVTAFHRKCMCVWFHLNLTEEGKPNDADVTDPVSTWGIWGTCWFGNVIQNEDQNVHFLHYFWRPSRVSSFSFFSFLPSCDMWIPNEAYNEEAVSLCVFSASASCCLPCVSLSQGADCSALLVQPSSSSHVCASLVPPPTKLQDVSPKSVNKQNRGKMQIPTQICIQNVLTV